MEQLSQKTRSPSPSKRSDASRDYSEKELRSQQKQLIKAMDFQQTLLGEGKQLSSGTWAVTSHIRGIAARCALAVKRRTWQAPRSQAPIGLGGASFELCP